MNSADSHIFSILKFLVPFSHLILERAGSAYYERLLSFLQKSFPDFDEKCRDNIHENQTCYSSEDVDAINTNNYSDMNIPNVIDHDADDISFDNAEYINNLKDSNDDDKNSVQSALPKMQSDFRVR